jgi:hypothetical protein
MGIRDRDTCRKYFRELEILLLKSQYIYIHIYLLSFVIKNIHHFEVNTEVHNMNTRTRFDLHHPVEDLSHNIKQFKVAFKDFLHSHSFYTLDKYFNYSKNWFFNVICVVQFISLSSEICICTFNDWSMICIWLLITQLYKCSFYDCSYERWDH